MSVLAALISSAVLSSADICDDPVPGGIGEPPFCTFSESTVIQTPFFSFEVQPEALIGIDHGGARVVIEGSIRQSPIGLRIVAHPMELQDELMRRFGVCGELSAESDSMMVCDESTEDFVRIDKLLVGTDRLIVAELTAGRVAFSQLPVYQKMLDSLRI